MKELKAGCHRWKSVIYEMPVVPLTSVYERYTPHHNLSSLIFGYGREQFFQQFSVCQRLELRKVLMKWWFLCILEIFSWLLVPQKWKYGKMLVRMYIGITSEAEQLLLLLNIFSLQKYVCTYYTLNITMCKK